MTGDRRSRGRPGVLPKAIDVDVAVLRTLQASRSSTASLSDLRALLADRAEELPESLWSLEAAGLVEVIESPTCGLICLITDRGRERLGGLAALGSPRG
jgi:hypothetical protein